MMRQCHHCRHPFSPQELARDESKGLEEERKSCGVQGVLFRLYSCVLCGHENLFVDLHPLDGETEEEMHRRREELEAALRACPPEGAEVVVTEKLPAESAIAS